jgi:hypothetical protein
MKNRLRWFTGIGMLMALVLGLSLAVPHGIARATTPAAGGIDDVRHAEGLLRDARAILAAAPGEYGGHRDKAIKRVDEALGECHAAIEHH